MKLWLRQTSKIWLTAKKPASYKGINQNANVHVDSSEADEIEYAFCAVDAVLQQVCEEYPTEMEKREEEDE